MAVSATILGCAGLSLSDQERAFFAASEPWGFILFARNVDTPAQLSALTAQLREAVGRDVPILIDQEGGRVQRMRAPHWREWAPALDQMSRGSAKAMRLRYQLIGHELRSVGIDVNCAPLADVARPDTHPVLKNRLYGDEPGLVAEVARAVADGLLDAGVLPVLKHLPGYGLGTVDSHASLPRVSASREELDKVDFAAFKPLSDLALGMTAHIVYDALDHEAPATMDAALISLIRDEIGFHGAIMTDDLSMGALPGPLSARAERSRAAGCDLILHCNGDLTEMEEVVAASGRLEGVSKQRTDRALALRAPAKELDIDAIEEELYHLLGGEVYV